MLLSPRSPNDGLQEQTLEYYERNARGYFQETVNTDLSAIYEPFIRMLPNGARILDAGSGSGRDTLAFVQRGYQVDAFDSSPALCELSTRFTGVRTRVLRLQEFEGEEEYDGIWACASLLHVPELELLDVMARLLRALKRGGVLFVSFKYGNGERVAEDGRFYTDMTEDRMRAVLQGVEGCKLGRLWRTAGEGKFRGQGDWLNALISQQEPGSLPHSLSA